MNHENKPWYGQPHLWWLIIILLAVLVYFSGISHESLWFDEVFSARMASRSPGEILQLMTGDNHPPLYYLLVQAAAPLGTSEAALRLLSALAGIAALPLLSYLGYSLSPRLLLRMVRARRIGPNQEPELRRIVENLSIGAGLPAPRLYIIESQAPNAFATGLDPGNASVVVTRGLLRLLERGELEGVIAHEFSHIGNRDTRLNMMTAALAITLRLPVTALHWLWDAVKKKLNGSPAEFRTTLGLAAYAVLCAPILLTFAVFFPAVPTCVRPEEVVQVSDAVDVEIHVFSEAPFNLTLENAVVPQEHDIVEAIRQVMYRRTRIFADVAD